jgi:hypothetical protein
MSMKFLPCTSAVTLRIEFGRLPWNLEILLRQAPDEIRTMLRDRVQGIERMQAGELINFLSKNTRYTLQHPAGRHTFRLLGSIS